MYAWSQPYRFELYIYVVLKIAQVRANLMTVSVARANMYAHFVEDPSQMRFPSPSLELHESGAVPDHHFSRAIPDIQGVTCHEKPWSFMFATC